GDPRPAQRPGPADGDGCPGSAHRPVLPRGAPVGEAGPGRRGPAGPGGTPGPGTGPTHGACRGTSGSAARPTYAEILSGRASPQPSGSVESTSRESPPTQQSPVRPPQQEKTMSQVEVEESASTEAEDHRPPSCQDGQ
ncbi:conserved hypothetical protein, partial [Ixodes scapularis]